MRLGRAPIALAGLIALAASAACGGSTTVNQAKAAAPPGTTASTTDGSGTVVTQTPIAPLTGLPDPSGDTTHRPALMVKIENAPEARPQSGLDTADVVFEEVVEGGVTRFIAVFHSSAPDPVGPVRSVRPMDPNIAGVLGGLFAYSGGIPDFQALLHKAPVQDVGYDTATAAYHWDNKRARPHNLYASPEQLWAKADDKHSAPPKPLFAFRAAGEPFGDTDAPGVHIKYSQLASVAYAWDAASGSWKRSQDGGPHMAASGAQIAPQNVIVQSVAMRKLRYVDPSGTAVYESIVTGDGDAWIFSGGRMTKGRWSKPDAASPTTYTDAAGNPVKLAPGRTWVHFAPQGAAVTVG